MLFETYLLIYYNIRTLRIKKGRCIIIMLKTIKDNYKRGEDKHFSQILTYIIVIIVILFNVGYNIFSSNIGTNLATKRTSGRCGYTGRIRTY